jgi:hypothetical protein
MHSVIGLMSIALLGSVAIAQTTTSLFLLGFGYDAQPLVASIKGSVWEICAPLRFGHTSLLIVNIHSMIRRPPTPSTVPPAPILTVPDLASTTSRAPPPCKCS